VPDQFIFPRCPKRTKASKVGDRLEKIGFSLPVGSKKEVEARMKLDLLSLKVPEAIQIHPF